MRSVQKRRQDSLLINIFTQDICIQIASERFTDTVVGLFFFPPPRAAFCGSGTHWGGNPLIPTGETSPGCGISRTIAGKRLLSLPNFRGRNAALGGGMSEPNVTTNSRFQKHIKPEWIRVPDAVHLSGLSRSKTYELIASGAIKSFSQRQRGAQRGVRLISYDSVIDYLESAYRAASTSPATAAVK